MRADENKRYRAPLAISRLCSDWLILVAALGVGCDQSFEAKASTTASPNNAPSDNFNSVLRLNGHTISETINPDGVSKRGEPKDFIVWLSGCRWAVHLIGNTNLPGAISQVTCDGTDIYLFVPDAAGRTVVNGKEMPFLQAGEVFPGVLKTWAFRMGPIWWAFCSSCVITNQPGVSTVPNFLNLAASGLKSRVTIEIETGSDRLNGTFRIRRAGPLDQAMYFATNTSEPLTLAATLTPLAVTETNGVSLVSTSRFTAYRPVGLGKSKPFQNLLMIITQCELVSDTSQFVPQISASCLVKDHRQPFSGEYLSTNWLEAGERKRVFRNPDTLLADSPKSQFLKIAARLALILAVVGPAVLYGVRHLGLKNKQT